MDAGDFAIYLGKIVSLEGRELRRLCSNFERNFIWILTKVRFVCVWDEEEWQKKAAVRRRSIWRSIWAFSKLRKLILIREEM